MSDHRTLDVIADISRKVDRLVALAAPDQAPNPADQSALLEHIASVSSQLEEAALHERIIAGAVALSGAERGFLMLLEERGKLRFKAGHGVSQELLLSGRFDGSSSLIKEVVRGARPILRGPRQDRSPTASMISGGVDTALCVPLPPGTRAHRHSASGMQVAGILYVDSRHPGHKLDQARLALLERYARHCGIAIENAWLYAQRS